jgi:hypothetical protein
VIDMTTDPRGCHVRPEASPRGAGLDWPSFPPGTPLTVVKRAPEGQEATRYPAVTVPAAVEPPWLCVVARWTNRRVEMDGLTFEPGDTLLECFSPAHRHNAFAVVAPDGRLRGWYGNVTHPPTLDLAADPPVLTWHDLYLDVVVLPDGTLTIRDEDELAEAALAVAAPDLHAAILAALDDLLARAKRRVVPFLDPDAVAAPASSSAVAAGPSTAENR